MPAWRKGKVIISLEVLHVTEYQMLHATSVRYITFQHCSFRKGLGWQKLIFSQATGNCAYINAETQQRHPIFVDVCWGPQRIESIIHTQNSTGLAKRRWFGVISLESPGNIQKHSDGSFKQYMLLFFPLFFLSFFNC